MKKVLDELQFEAKKLYKFRFIFVDDCSTDDTTQKLEEIYGKRENCKVICHDQNRGVAGAMDTGIKAADTEIVGTMDADCSYNPPEFLKMIALLKDNIDIVTASPYHREGSVVGVPKWRLFLSKTLSSMYHFLLNHKLATYTSCFRVCRRNRGKVININRKYEDFRGVIELLARLDINGWNY